MMLINQPAGRGSFQLIQAAVNFGVNIRRLISGLTCLRSRAVERHPFWLTSSLLPSPKIRVHTMLIKWLEREASKPHLTRLRKGGCKGDVLRCFGSLLELHIMQHLHQADPSDGARRILSRIIWWDGPAVFTTCGRWWNPSSARL